MWKKLWTFDFQVVTESGIIIIPQFIIIRQTSWQINISKAIFKPMQVPLVMMTIFKLFIFFLALLGWISGVAYYLTRYFSDNGVVSYTRLMFN